MTRKEEIINAAYNEAEVERQLKMHPQVFEQGFVAGAKWADRTMIEDACEWLDCYIDNYLFIDAENKAGIKWDDFINDFREAMKGEEKQGNKLDADKVIAWLVANICDFEYYVKLFKKDFGL